MYIPIGPSKKDLYKIILGLLILIYIIFLGMYKPKAESLATWYSTSGLQFYNYFYRKSDITINANNNYRFDLVQLYDLPQGTDTLQFGFTYFEQGGENNFNDNGTISCTYTENNICYRYNFYNDISVQIYVNETQYCKLEQIDNSNTTITFNVECPIKTTNYDKLNVILVNNGNTRSHIYLGFSYIFSAYNKNNSNVVNNINNSTNQINDSINDSSIDSSSANNLTNNSAFQDSNGLDAIIKAPLNFIQSLTSSTCSSISLTIPYIDANVSLPCMSTIYTKALGQQLVNLIALVINGVVLYRYCLKILQLVHNAKNPNKDELEVLDL